MKTEDRAAAAAKRPVAVGPTPGDRLPTPPRERKPALAALAALLVLVGALGATMLVLRAGERVEAVMITERIPAGQAISADAIRSVLVADNTDVQYVKWSQRSQLTKLRAETDLLPGSVLVGSMLTDEADIGEGQAIVGVTLQPGQFPPGLQAGDTIDAYWVGDESDLSENETGIGTTPDTVLVAGAKVTEIQGGDKADGTSALAMRLRVDVEDVPGLTRAASEDNVAVVIVGSGTSN